MESKILNVQNLGEINLKEIDGLYMKDFSFHSSQVSLLIFDTDFSTKTLAFINSELSDLDNTNKANLEVLGNHYDKSNDENVINAYIVHHLEVIPKEELSNIIDFDKNDLNTQMLNKLKLVYISVDEEGFIRYDYSLGSEITNYVLCIEKDSSGEITDILIES